MPFSQLAPVTLVPAFQMGLASCLRVDEHTGFRHITSQTSGAASFSTVPSRHSVPVQSANSDEESVT